MKSFESWTLEDIQTDLGVKQIDESEVLTEWLSSKKEISEFTKTNIEYLKSKLKKNVNSWNEDELKMHFIGPFLMQIDFITDNYKSFTQRTLTAKLNDIEVSGKVDYMVATGMQKPKRPFFFLHEYKPARRVVNDPDGQLLIEMLAAQELNQSKHPLYGVVVEGRSWFFVVLHEKTFAISNPYDACDVAIYQIFAILCRVKDYIEEILAQQQ